ncbi:leucyl/phenylalanyl-tRNA--protein transferase [Sphingomicrobium clamense]|uniref:Leucyl/phenylalanyl-tRNA--protein transferase n=1 Tax=Sphingomicrobium clamense TaxID=2851013 RepID=A0ABS6V4Z1_9SPHN|nr:leucyl/phenylalanyl-tRNA--protein transferase [Sphingomicrobium sp. B8]MBW0144566.1 leucyl/phenylalanyl-tRNA--protein transferase [Sphingomicrobium sp. B8]
MAEVLDPRMLLRGYGAGIFPMADSRDAPDILWVEPRERAVIPLDGFHLSRSLARTIRREVYDVRIDTAFADVVRGCAARPETWINETIERATLGLHAAGHAHSIECWLGDRLVGGVYGVRLGGAFFGESMYSDARDASKVALAHLVARMKVGGFKLLDCQFMTDHLASLGAVAVPRERYLDLLDQALSAGSATGSGAGASGSGVSSGSSPAASPSPSLGAVAMLDDPGRRAGGGSPSGKLIVQLLGQASNTGCSTTLSDGDSA